MQFDAWLKHVVSGDGTVQVRSQQRAHAHAGPPAHSLVLGVLSCATRVCILGCVRLIATTFVLPLASLCVSCSQSIPAPYLPVVHIPPDMLAVRVPGLGGAPLLLPLKYLYLAGILVGLWLCSGLIARHFGSFLYLIFALSILVPGYELLRDVYTKYA